MLKPFNALIPIVITHHFSESESDHRKCDLTGTEAVATRAAGGLLCLTDDLGGGEWSVEMKCT